MPIAEVLVTVAEKTAEVTKKAVETTEKIIEKTAEVTEKVAETAESAVDKIRETPNRSIEVSAERSFLYSKLEEVQQYTPEQLQAKVDENLEMQKGPELDTDYEQLNSREGLTDEEKTKLKEETGWSDEIIDSISSMEEAEIYKASLKKIYKKTGVNIFDIC